MNSNTELYFIGTCMRFKGAGIFVRLLTSFTSKCLWTRVGELVPHQSTSTCKLFSTYGTFWEIRSDCVVYLFVDWISRRGFKSFITHVTEPRKLRGRTLVIFLKIPGEFYWTSLSRTSKCAMLNLNICP